MRTDGTDDAGTRKKGNSRRRENVDVPSFCEIKKIYMCEKKSERVGTKISLNIGGAMSFMT